MAADDPLSCPQKPDVQLQAPVGEGALHGPSVEGAEDGWRQNGPKKVEVVLGFTDRTLII